MHNLSTVFSFEVYRTLKKKSFWIMSLLFPILAIAIGAIIYFSNQATSQAASNTADQHFTITYTDESGLINKKVAEQYGATVVDKQSDGVNEVKSGSVDAYIYYPKNVTDKTVEVYGKDVGLFDNSRYQTVAKAILQQSVSLKVSAADSAVLQGNVSYDSTTYRDGAVYDGYQQLIMPGIFLVLFYILLATFANQILTGTTEEKENRVMEMILTTVRARTLVVGKILSLVVLGLFQMVVTLTPIVVGYLLFHDKLQLPDIDLSSIPFDWGRITVGFVVFMTSFMFFTGLLVALGSAMPTAKEASSFMGVIMMLLFGPLYAVTLFVSSPDAGIVQFLSYFPFTAPIPLLLRNAVGNLEYWQAVIAILILLVSTIIAMAIAVRIFKYGALEYSRRLKFSEVFGLKRP